MNSKVASAVTKILQDIMPYFALQVGQRIAF